MTNFDGFSSHGNLICSMMQYDVLRTSLTMTQDHQSIKPSRGWSKNSMNNVTYFYHETFEKSIPYGVAKDILAEATLTFQIYKCDGPLDIFL